MSDENAKVLPFLPKSQKSAEPMPKMIFPEIYRLEGYREITASKKRKEVVKLPKYVKRIPEYTFNDQCAFNFEKPKWTLVTKLDPKIDYGWVVIRHHHDDSHIEGFLDNQYDRMHDEEDAHTLSQVMSTEYGTFSLVHRAAAKDAPDHLLILIYATNNDKPLTLQDRIKRPNNYTICHPDGSITHDMKLLFPFMKTFNK